MGRGKFSTPAIDSRNIEAIVMMSDCFASRNDIKTAQDILQKEADNFPDIHEISAKLEETAGRLEVEIIEPQEKPQTNEKDSK